MVLQWKISQPIELEITEGNSVVDCTAATDESEADYVVSQRDHANKGIEL